MNTNFVQPSLDFLKSNGNTTKKAAKTFLSTLPKKASNGIQKQQQSNKYTL